jgi:pyruvate/2-oxoacid:ferredoxin oxidoreductase alpha subunit
MIEGGGTLAYEIYSTLRQYVSLKNNDGYEGNGVNYRDPLQITKVPLPVIEGFAAEKRFPIKGKTIVNKLDKAHETKDYMKVWQVVGEYVERKYPELVGYSQARIEREDNHYVMIAKGARKKEILKN